MRPVPNVLPGPSDGDGGGEAEAAGVPTSAAVAEDATRPVAPETEAESSHVGEARSPDADARKGGVEAEERESNGTMPEVDEAAERTGAGEAAEGTGTPPNEAADMDSSVATIRPPHPPSGATAAPPGSSADLKDRPDHGLCPVPYLDPTPQTPFASRPASRPPSRPPSNPRSDSVAGPSASASASPTVSDYDEKRYASEDEQDSGSTSEIQSIMDQFDEAGGGPGEEEVMSPRLEIASPNALLGGPHTARTSSSLHSEASGPELRSPTSPPSLQSHGFRSPNQAPADDERGPPVPPKDHVPPRDSEPLAPLRHVDPVPVEDAPLSPTVHRPPLPEPEPETALSFDFHRFLEQLRHKKADPVARYLKSFLSEFGKRQWMVHEQVKIISDFLAFISAKMGQCDVWREVSEAEFDNAREGMEKLVMNRLYGQTFSPAIPPPQPIPGAKPGRRGGERPMGPGRRGQHQEDVERDDVLAQKIKIYGWVREQHLDIPPVGDSEKKFLRLAQLELLKIRSYRAPRDKIICVLNCCKVIFGLLRHAKSDTSADSFMPLLIYVVLQANPEHLVSNVQYILRFRNQEKLGGEAGYYLSSLHGAIQFIENMDRTTLTISDDEFERNVEAAVSAIAERHRLEAPAGPPPDKPTPEPAGLAPPAEGDASSSPLSFPLRLVSSSSHDHAGGGGGGSESSSDERAPMAGLLRTIQRPLSSIGRIFTEEITGSLTSPIPPSNTPYASGAASSLRAPGHHYQQQPQAAPGRDPSPDDRTGRPQQSHHHHHHHRLSAEEAAARQASAEAAEAQRLHRAEHANVVETLAAMFPDLDRDIISDVVYQKEGRVGLAVDACLALST